MKARSIRVLGLTIVSVRRRDGAYELTLAGGKVVTLKSARRPKLLRN